jgi:organic hydroperoxide reductase OsmC/OhrA
MTSTAVRPKQFTFPVAVEWLGGRRVVALVEGKPGMEVMPPPAFRGTDPHTWSPEDFLVASAASCLAVTFTGLVERARLSLATLRVEGAGIVGRRGDGRFGFTALQLSLHVVVPPAEVEAALRLAAQAEADCLVAASLSLPVIVELDVRGCDGG